MHHKNSIISILMGGFLALSLAACESPQPPYPNGSTTTTTDTTGTTSTTTNTGPTTTGDTTSTSTTTTAPTTSSTTTTLRDTWSFVGVANNMAWTVHKNGADQSPPTPVTVRVGDTVEWRTGPGAFPHGVVFNTQAAAEGMLTFLPGGQTLQGSACVPGFTWGTNMCGGFPANTVLARATVKATGSLRFTCEVHGPANMTVDLNATP